ncbi:MAG TPA: hypothetical protein ENF21_04755 [Bacteroidetes bacterium]|nr:hypothetical protein [Bacteroidota bacterium]
MQKVRNTVIMLAALVILARLLMIDYANLGWAENRGSYLGILSMSLVILAMVLVSRQEKKKENS